MNDPYPATLSEIDEAYQPTQDPMLVALNRIAAALERMSAPVTIQNGPQRPTNLAALPPVTTVANKPVCPFHGAEKVASSTNGKGGFYCQAKAQPGQPANAKGYCTWHS